MHVLHTANLYVTEEFELKYPAKLYFADGGWAPVWFSGGITAKIPNGTMIFID